ncbi:MAG: serine protease Do [Flavobacterium sp.]|jgi:serine protease Do
MKKIISIFSIFISFVTTAQNLADCYENVKSSVVVVNILNIEPKTIGSKLTFLAKSLQGSGVLVSEDGLIWTASHIVQSAEFVKVEFSDGTIYEAEVFSSNTLADVALIKIKGDFNIEGKTIAKLGDSDKLRIGEDVFVLGAPFGLKQSISKGILSGRHIPENLTDDFNKIEFLQTDAVINEGSSGGPMFNMKGEVVGITSSIYTLTGGFSGIGFAISSNTANKILMEEPNIWTGMESVVVTGNVAKALNIPKESGLLVLSLSSKGMANKIGLRAGTINATIDGTELVIGGDIILDFAGINFDTNDFRNVIRKKIEEFHKEDIIPMTILRNGKIVTIEFEKE